MHYKFISADCTWFSVVTLKFFEKNMFMPFDFSGRFCDNNFLNASLNWYYEKKNFRKMHNN